VGPAHMRALPQPPRTVGAAVAPRRPPRSSTDERERKVRRGRLRAPPPWRPACRPRRLCAPERKGKETRRRDPIALLRFAARIWPLLLRHEGPAGVTAAMARRLCFSLGKEGADTVRGRMTPGYVGIGEGECDNPPRKVPYYRLRPIHFGH
jgi:hypothetical protein